MTLCFEMLVWLAMGLLAGAIGSRRWLGVTVLASASAAFTCGMMMRIVDGSGWSSSDVDFLALAAAACGAILGTVAMRALLESTPTSSRRH